MRKEEADQETTKAANSTMGNAKSLSGIQRSRRMVRMGCALGTKNLNCDFEGLPLWR